MAQQQQQLSSATSSSATLQQEQTARDLKKLEDILLKLHRTKITIENFQEGSQQVLNEYLNGIVKDFEILKNDVTNTNRIPLSVIQLVDEGKNPDTFTEKCIDSASMRLQATKGKIAALEYFHKSLRKEIENSFGDEYHQYLAEQQQAAK